MGSDPSSKQALADRFSQYLGLPPDQAAEEADHCVGFFLALFEAQHEIAHAKSTQEAHQADAA